LGIAAPRFLQARWPSCHPTNSAEALTGMEMAGSSVGKFTVIRQVTYLSNANMKALNMSHGPLRNFIPRTTRSISARTTTGSP